MTTQSVGKSFCPCVLSPEVTRARSLVPCFRGLQNMDLGTSRTRRRIQIRLVVPIIASNLVIFISLLFYDVVLFGLLHPGFISISYVHAFSKLNSKITSQHGIKFQTIAGSLIPWSMHRWVIVSMVHVIYVPSPYYKTYPIANSQLLVLFIGDSLFTVAC